MPTTLTRYQQTGDTHFVTFSCYQRKPYLGNPTTRDIFLESLETMRIRYQFHVFGYVVMPEHVHLLVSEPKTALLAKVVQALKLSVSVQSKQSPFWHTRYYDFNVYTQAKHIEKLKYIHRNPVVRGLVQKPEDWRWSSFQHYSTGAPIPVQIESWRTTTQRQHSATETTPLEDKQRVGEM
ncbi:MAG TPA: transposase [Acidobacteriaceae bacterium]|jgi:putative transposase|nr:transposase [Acidobacteriaceae bacterium]